MTTSPSMGVGLTETFNSDAARSVSHGPRADHSTPLIAVVGSSFRLTMTARSRQGGRHHHVTCARGSRVVEAAVYFEYFFCRSAAAARMSARMMSGTLTR